MRRKGTVSMIVTRGVVICYGKCDPSRRSCSCWLQEMSERWKCGSSGVACVIVSAYEKATRWKAGCMCSIFI